MIGILRSLISFAEEEIKGIVHNEGRTVCQACKNCLTCGLCACGQNRKKK